MVCHSRDRGASFRGTYCKMRSIHIRDLVTKSNHECRLSLQPQAQVQSQQLALHLPPGGHSGLQFKLERGFWRSMGKVVSVWQTFPRIFVIGLTFLLLVCVEPCRSSGDTRSHAQFTIRY